MYYQDQREFKEDKSIWRVEEFGYWQVWVKSKVLDSQKSKSKLRKSESVIISTESLHLHFILSLSGPGVAIMLRCLLPPRSPAPADKWSLTGWRVALSMNTLINNDTKTNIQLVTSHYSAPATTQCNVHKRPHQSEMWSIQDDWYWCWQTLFNESCVLKSAWNVSRIGSMGVILAIV